MWSCAAWKTNYSSSTKRLEPSIVKRGPYFSSLSKLKNSNYVINPQGPNDSIVPTVRLMFCVTCKRYTPRCFIARHIYEVPSLQRQRGVCSVVTAIYYLLLQWTTCDYYCNEPPVITTAMNHLGLLAGCSRKRGCTWKPQRGSSVVNEVITFLGSY